MVYFFISRRKIYVSRREIYIPKREICISRREIENVFVFSVFISLLFRIFLFVTEYFCEIYEECQGDTSLFSLAFVYLRHFVCLLLGLCQSELDGQCELHVYRFTFLLAGSPKGHGVDHTDGFGIQFG